MMKLNLIAENQQEELVKAYLEEHASEELAEKINNGTLFEKDGKPLTNKKTLAGFMKYACEEARKIAKKGENAACIEDKVVYGWAIHYFEEDSIEGTLYLLDGSEYQPERKMSKPVEKAPVKKVPEQPDKDQLSFFNLSKPVETEEERIEDEEEEEPEEAAPIPKKDIDETTGELLVEEDVYLSNNGVTQNETDLEKYYDPECLLRISELLDGQISMG